MSETREPCESCPWRIGVDAWAIGRDHTPEVPPLHRREMQDIASRQATGFVAPIMACHLTFRGEEAIEPQERVCAGFVLSEDGGNCIPLRLLAIQRAIDLRRFECPDPLHPNFSAMLAANPPREGA